MYHRSYYFHQAVLPGWLNSDADHLCKGGTIATFNFHNTAAMFMLQALLVAPCN